MPPIKDKRWGTYVEGPEGQSFDPGFNEIAKHPTIPLKLDVFVPDPGIDVTIEPGRSWLNTWRRLAWRANPFIAPIRDRADSLAAFRQAHVFARAAQIVGNAIHSPDAILLNRARWIAKQALSELQTPLETAIPDSYPTNIPITRQDETERARQLMQASRGHPVDPPYNA